MPDIIARISRASMVQGLTALAGKAANVVFGILLARLLFPEDYGLFAITLVITSLANMVSNFGFQSYIIQARELSQRLLDTCYTLNLVLSLLLGAVVMAIGQLWPDPPPYLPQMFALYGLHIFVSGLSYIELAVMKRELDFSASSRAELLYTVSSTGGRVAFALAHFGALSFALGDLAGSLLRFLAVRRMTRMRLQVLRPREVQAGEALWFGVHATSTGLASFFANQTDKFLLAAQFPMATIGLYAFSGNAAALFYSAFIVPQTSVFLATFARLRDDIPAARQLLHSSTRFVFSMALPVNMLLLLETGRIVAVVYTEKWLPAVPLIQVLVLDFLVRSMFSGVTGLQISFGLAAQAARTKWANALLIVACLLLATLLKLDIIGFAIAAVIGNVLATLNNLRINGRLVAMAWWPFLRNLLAPAAIAAASTLAWWALSPYFDGMANLPGLLAASLVWLLAYGVLTLAFNRRVLDALFAALRGRAARGPQA